MVLFVKSLLWFAIVLTFPVYARPWKPSCSLHRSFWNSSGRGSSPKNICNLNPPSLLALILRNRNNDLLALRCQPSRHFVFKDKLRSKNAGKVQVLVCWHHVTSSVDRSEFCRLQTFKFWPKSALKSASHRFKNGALKLRLWPFCEWGARNFEIDYSHGSVFFFFTFVKIQSAFSFALLFLLPLTIFVPFIQSVLDNKFSAWVWLLLPCLQRDSPGRENKAITELGCVSRIQISGYLDIRMSEIRISSERLHVSDRNVFGVDTCPDIRMHYTRHTRYV